MYIWSIVDETLIGYIYLHEKLCCTMFPFGHKHAISQLIWYRVHNFSIIEIMGFFANSGMQNRTAYHTRQKLKFCVIFPVYSINSVRINSICALRHTPLLNSICSDCCSVFRWCAKHRPKPTSLFNFFPLAAH